MVKKNRNVAERYDEYKLLMERSKSLVECEIMLSPKENHQSFWVGDVEVKHVDINEIIRLIAEVGESTGYCGFKLLADFLTSEPCFRFDSDGPAHENRLPDIPLPQRQVTTPHFHRFNRDGVMLAYKTAVLETPSDCKALLQDNNLAAAHFCQEGKIELEKNRHPRVVQKDYLLSSTGATDPLAGISFA